MSDSTPPLPATPAETPAAKAGPSNLRLRVIWGVIGAALLLGSVWFSPFTFGLFFAFVQAVMLWEFYRMMRAGGYAPATWLGIGVGLLLFITASEGYLTSPVSGDTEDGIHFMNANPFGLLIISSVVCGTLLPLVLLVREMKHWPSAKQPFVNAATTVFGLLYITLPMTMLHLIAFSKDESKYEYSYDYRRIFALLFLIWASDIGAYAAGKTFGKHKMAPKISPGKTWEGWAGGFLMTLIVGWAIGFMLPDLPLTHRLVAAGVVAVFAPLGDLAESMLKRSVGVKDSGSIMPGHGGLLDRFDAFLLVLPVLALLQLLAG
ncbi:phosphatidate cytidylyltransferase [Hymenobacter ruricola]|uniref:Phosphatidate cytidylyltransferase n=1 Tax=Hymenobacter ruricola TaxID=2791023 RepID=A0ABS0I851_9BACT|nr:phosphatidate cytidylyltransferase [Hymenobacter ruricola]MBF9222868.1 phosphatidate cytidylyltransferase [Hymenobacter ruricola]